MLRYVTLDSPTRTKEQIRFRYIMGPAFVSARTASGGARMNNIIYIVGLVVVVMAILSFVGLG